MDVAACIVIVLDIFAPIGVATIDPMREQLMDMIIRMDVPCRRNEPEITISRISPKALWNP